MSVTISYVDEDAKVEKALRAYFAAEKGVSNVTGKIPFGQHVLEDSDLWEKISKPILNEKMDDPVNSPSHYTAYKGLEVIDLTEQMNFNRGNAVKYIARAGLKNPEKEIEDLEKARWYIDREIEKVKRDKGLI